MTIDDAQKDLTIIVDGATWRFSELALAMIDERTPTGQRGQTPLTRDQQISVLRTMAGDAEIELARSADARRLRAVVDGAGRPLDPEKAAQAEQIALAVIYRAIAEGGRAATIPIAQHHSLVESFGADIADFAAQQILLMAKGEDLDGDRWALGPPRSYFEEGLRNAGCEVSLNATRLIRRDYLLICAALPRG